MKRCYEEMEPERTETAVLKSAIFDLYILRNKARVTSVKLEAHEVMLAGLQSRSEANSTGVTVDPNPASSRSQSGSVGARVRRRGIG